MKRLFLVSILTTSVFFSYTIEPKKALIFGITGQDGAYLAEFLLKKNYSVHGVKRRSSSFNTARIDHLYHDMHEGCNNFTLHYGDVTDSTNIVRIIQEVQPDEIYNLAAQSHVQEKVWLITIIRSWYKKKKRK